MEYLLVCVCVCVCDVTKILLNNVFYVWYLIFFNKEENQVQKYNIAVCSICSLNIYCLFYLLLNYCNYTRVHRIRGIIYYEYFLPGVWKVWYINKYLFSFIVVEILYSCNSQLFSQRRAIKRREVWNSIKELGRIIVYQLNWIQALVCTITITFVIYSPVSDSKRIC